VGGRNFVTQGLTKEDCANVPFEEQQRMQAILDKSIELSRPKLRQRVESLRRKSPSDAGLCSSAVEDLMKQVNREEKAEISV
jgi:hypothetical protein